eukprot:INCI14097.1.p1 GENE.INCI14097.1~~INCI14097.1.p1  ORF type:complete len:271 (-),score=33.25 INCI14097.1:130-942(-)
MRLWTPMGGLLICLVLAGVAAVLFVNLVPRTTVAEGGGIKRAEPRVEGLVQVVASRQEHPQSKVRAFCLVPARIHFVNGLWSDGSDLTAKQEEALATWRQHSPDFDIRIWNREKVEELLGRVGTFHGFNLLDVFQHLAYRGQMTDLARYAINFFKGGVYADIDVYNYRNIREMFECASGGVRESQSSGDLGSPPFAPFFYAVTEKPSLQQANYFFCGAPTSSTNGNCFDDSPAAYQCDDCPASSRCLVLDRARSDNACCTRMPPVAGRTV